MTNSYSNTIKMHVFLDDNHVNNLLIGKMIKRDEIKNRSKTYRIHLGRSAYEHYRPFLNYQFYQN